MQLDPSGSITPEQHATLAHGAVLYSSDIVQVAEAHRASPAFVEAPNCRTLLDHCQRDIHHRVAARALHLEKFAVIDSGPFPQGRDVRIWGCARFSLRCDRTRVGSKDKCGGEEVRRGDLI
jgi:hypothetical protein